MNLRRRMAMLKGVYKADMPYRDPHTAGPGLWALRDSMGASFEVGFCEVDGDTQWRNALEDVAIALHGERHGASPTLNFGKMPDGYQMSSGNNARLVAAGKRFRGGPSDKAGAEHEAGIGPIGSLDADTTGPRWCGHRWCEWRRLTAEAISAALRGSGLYRIAGNGSIVYIGEGNLKARLRAHAAKLTAGTPQGEVLAAAAAPKFSSVAGAAWNRRQRLELETDLIAAYVLAERAAPAAQFVG
jgi:hypothetical protein